MIDTELDQSLKLSNSFCGPTYMSVNYEGCRPDSETMVWTVKLAHGAQHYEYRLLEGGSAPICVIRDVNDPKRSRAVDFSGPDHDEVMQRMDEAVKLVTGTTSSFLMGQVRS